MRTFLAAAVVLSLLSTAALAADDAGVQDTLKQFKAAWDKHDAKAIAALCTDDGTLINPVGDKASGRAEIEKLIAGEHAGPFKGTTYSYADVTIQWLTPDIAAVDYTGTVAGILGPDGAAAPDLVHHCMMVMTKTDGKWSLAVCRPYVLLGKPMNAK